MGVARDRISELPDQILEDEILSRLPTKLAVSTSILSKRWRWLWTGVSALQFSHHSDHVSRPEETKMFINYVDYVLLHHRIPDLRSFELEWFQPFTPDRLEWFLSVAFDRVHSWIAAAVASNTLHELKITIPEIESSEIPTSVYHLQSLLRLKIAHCNSVFQLPTSISLPSLTTLELSHLIFMSEHEMQRFLSSLPSLKHLGIYNSMFFEYVKLEISSPSLERLRIECVEFVTNEIVSPIIKVCAPQLRYLHCDICSPDREYIVSNMPLLEEACIDEGDYLNQALTMVGVHLNANNLLKNLVNVKKLRVHTSILKSFPREDLMRRCLPFLTNLTYLQVFFPCHGSDLLSVLQIMPNLEYLTLCKVHTSDEDELTPYVGEMLPQCFRLRIREIEISEYNGSPESSRIIGFLLNNIPDLKIAPFTNLGDNQRDLVRTIRLQRDSVQSHCQLKQ